MKIELPPEFEEVIPHNFNYNFHLELEIINEINEEKTKELGNNNNNKRII